MFSLAFRFQTFKVTAFGNHKEKHTLPYPMSAPRTAAEPFLVANPPFNNMVHGWLANLRVATRLRDPV